MISPARLPLPGRVWIGPDAAAFAVGAAATLGVVLVAAHKGAGLPLSVLWGSLVFLAVLIGFMKAPHIANGKPTTTHQTSARPAQATSAPRIGPSNQNGPKIR